MTRYLGAIQRGDRAAAYECFADDVVGHVPGRSSLAGELRGKGAVKGYIDAVFARVSHVEVELVDMLASDERFALIVDEHIGDLDIRRCNVYTVRDGLINEIQIFEANQYEVDEFLSDEA